MPENPLKNFKERVRAANPKANKIFDDENFHDDVPRPIGPVDPEILPNIPNHKELVSGLEEEIRRLELELAMIPAKLTNLEECRLGILSIPVLFDDADLNAVYRKIDVLKRAGVHEIKVGERVYSIEEIDSIMTKVDQFSRELHSGRHLDIEDPVSLIDTFLAEIGVTRAKIHEHSERGFRECLSKVIMNDTRALGGQSPGDNEVVRKYF